MGHYRKYLPGTKKALESLPRAVTWLISEKDIKLQEMEK